MAAEPASRAGPACGRVVERDDRRPPSWLPGPHLPTIWANACRRVAQPSLRMERLELPDGDFVDLAWTGRAHGPVVVVLHGLEGSCQSPYARALLGALDAAGYRAVLMHFRGCSGELNRRERSYHSGDTGDLAHLVETLSARHAEPPFAAVGYSLGGNVLLKWLGETGAGNPLATAVAVSVPFELGACAERLDEGFSRFYQQRLLHSMRAKYRAKFARRAAPIDPGDVGRLRSFWAWDDAVTAPLHGFRDAVDYYHRSSSRRFLRQVDVPTLILHAVDDPFVPARAIPGAAELGAPVTLELSTRGGHVGFVHRGPAGLPRYWLEQRIVRHLLAHGAPTVE